MEIVPAPQFQFFAPIERDILAELLAERRSENTRRAYKKDLTDFFKFATGVAATPEMIAQFLSLDRFTAIGLVFKYKSALIEKGLAEATINRRLAAIKSLTNYAQKVGKCDYSLNDVKGEKVQKYRDTSGVPVEMMQAMLSVPNRETPKGIRDYAILRLLWNHALRRSEVVQANIEDFAGTELWIRGKGKGTQKTAIELSSKTASAIARWLEVRGTYQEKDPLFISLDPGSNGSRLCGDGVYYLVKEVAAKAGVTKKFSPHRVRHSSITNALDATGGDVRRVQKLSRHSSFDTLMIYDDNRQGHQAEISNILDDLA